MDTTSTAPWWYVAALAGGFTILGGLISLLASFLSDKRRLNHDDAHRYDDDLRRYAASYITHMISARDQLKLLRRLPESADADEAARLSIATAREDLVSEMRGARMVLDELTIVAPVEVRDAARQFFLYVHQLRRDKESDLWDEQYWFLLHRFIGATRKAVGLPMVEVSGSWISAVADVRRSAPQAR
jgi:hypothetical protein